MQIFKDFGVNPVLLLAQIVNFLIILYVLKRFMYKPVLSMLKKREDEIKKGLNDSEKNQKLLIETIEKEREILHKANEKAGKIVNDAKLEAEQARNEIELSTKKETERMLERARETIAQETNLAEERLTKKIGEIAIALLEKSLTGIFGEKEQKLILKKAETQILKTK